MLWLKAFHLIAMVAWFSGLFYLPRLFVYHASAKDDLGIERFKLMERRLYRYITTPAMLATLVFGGWMLALNWSFYMKAGWMHAKLLLIVLLIGYTHMCGAMVKRFAQDKNQRSEKFYRWFNEVPTLFLIAIILLAVLKPF